MNFGLEIDVLAREALRPIRERLTDEEWQQVLVRVRHAMADMNTNAYRDVCDKAADFCHDDANSVEERRNVRTSPATLRSMLAIQGDVQMQTAIVETEDQARDAVALAEKKGLRLAAVSNIGLPNGWKRLTFLPASAFTDSPSEEAK